MPMNRFKLVVATLTLIGAATIVGCKQKEVSSTDDVPATAPPAPTPAATNPSAAPTHSGAVSTDPGAVAMPDIAAFGAKLDTFVGWLERTATAVETAGRDCAKVATAITPPIGTVTNPDDFPPATLEALRVERRDTMEKVGAARKRINVVLEPCLADPAVKILLTDWFSKAIHGGSEPVTR